MFLIQRLAAICGGLLVASCTPPGYFESFSCSHQDTFGWTSEKARACQDAAYAQQHPVPPPEQRVSAESMMREQEKEKRDAANQARIAQAQASPRLIAYENKTKPFYQMLGEAEEVRICQLRSEGWLRSIEYGAQVSFGSDDDFRQLSPGEQEAVTVFAKNTMADAMSPVASNFQRECATFVNSERIARLDRLQSRMTGGYH